jgi:asparagine synthase (glutamine-hydrolysing)
MGGGVPTPIPELQDLFARGRFSRFWRQLDAWALKMRRSRGTLFCETLRGFLTPSPAGLGFSKELDSPPWLDPAFVRRNCFALRGYPSRRRLFGARPSFQNHLATLNALRREMALFVPRPETLCERRYPYLDRSLLEFMYAIPPDQIVRMGQRRSLMKRALAGIVPSEVLSKKQKPDLSATRKWPDTAECMIATELGIVIPGRFSEALENARCKKTMNGHALHRTLLLEAWLEHLIAQRILSSSHDTMRTPVTADESVNGRFV